MRRVPVVEVLLLLLALALLCAAPVSGWAAPTIQSDKTNHAAMLRSGDPSPRYAYSTGVRFPRPAERESITSVSVQTPGGERPPMAVSPACLSCDLPGTEVVLCVGWWESAEPGDPPAIAAGGGTYTVTVRAGSVGLY